jgi:PKD repeat protein
MSRIGGLERTRLPDFSIGATVLVVAIALPFFVFTRVEHARRIAAPRPAAAAPSGQVRAITTTPDPTAPVLAVPPQAASKATPSGRPSAKPGAVPPPSVRATPTTAPTSTPTPTPTPAPDLAPVAVLTLSVTSGPAPLTVVADASGSTDTDQTPIAKVIFNFGDGTVVTAQSGMTATHTYSSPGTYTVAVAVIDTAHLSTTVSATVTVS